MGCMMDLAYPPSWRNCKSQTLYNEVPQIEGHTDTAVWKWRAAMLRNSQVRFGGGRLETQVMLCAGRLSYAVISCQYESDAKRILRSLVKRLEKYGLKLNEEKTRFVSFSKRSYVQGVKQEVFDFLGFTFYIGRSRKVIPIPKVKSSGKRLRGKLKRVNQWARSVRSRYPLAEIWRMFRAKLEGHIRYYGVSFNKEHVSKFLQAATRILFK
jgi:RNA-directed DNA polymerase